MADKTMTISTQETAVNTHHASTVKTRNGSTVMIVPPHPLGVKPAGNQYTTPENAKSAAGSFAVLPDEIIMLILEFLNEGLLLRLGATCKALYAFSMFDELWKTLLIGSNSPVITWRGTWRSTCLDIPKKQLPRIYCKNLFSDVLHRPFLCAHTPLVSYVTDIPANNLISRLLNLSPAEYLRSWINKPFILTEPVRDWPAYRNWSHDGLLEKYAKVKFRAEAVDWPLETYMDYMNNNQDESPLYLFDRSFVEKMNIIVGKEFEGQYWIPECFGEDFFAVLEAQRPDHRWLIIGPERSGSTFHKDPNATSAWNAVLRGSKYWIMFPTSPSSPPPPGVFVSEDQSEVTSPLSISEWLLCFHAEARRTPGCVEGVCNEGEVLHVPSGWWHLVVNLSPSIAITQNFVPRAHLANVLAFLKNKSDQVSGFRSDVKAPYNTFMSRLRERHSEILETLGLVEQMEKGKKRKWDEVAKGNGEQQGDKVPAFCFGFGNESEECIPDLE